MPFGKVVANTLKEWKLKSPRRAGLPQQGRGTVEYHTHIVNRGFIPAVIAAGVVTKDGKAKYTGLHALRHFYASLCINSREDGGFGLLPKAVQERMGHSSITVTYGHLRSPVPPRRRHPGAGRGRGRSHCDTNATCWLIHQ